MLKDPKRFKELQKELDATLGNDDAPSHEILMKIPLLDAFIDEGLRMNPPLPFHVQRVAPEGGAEIAGVYLPEGTHVRLASYSIQRDPRNFKDPERFMPERWIAKKDDPNNVPFEKNAFLPLCVALVRSGSVLIALTPLCVAAFMVMRLFYFSAYFSVDI